MAVRHWPDARSCPISFENRCWRCLCSAHRDNQQGRRQRDRAEPPEIKLRQERSFSAVECFFLGARRELCIERVAAHQLWSPRRQIGGSYICCETTKRTEDRDGF